jgi:hypothetical protein
MNWPSNTVGAAGVGSTGIAMTGSASKARVPMVKRIRAHFGTDSSSFFSGRLDSILLDAQSLHACSMWNGFESIEPQGIFATPS